MKESYGFGGIGGLSGPKKSSDCLTAYGTSSGTPQTTSPCSSVTGNKFCFVNNIFEKKIKFLLNF
jgi:hypothetical protein